MAEQQAILDLWRTQGGRTQGASGILVTLVGVEGSSYRRPGAHMFIHAGRYAGSISGGCLEGEVVRKAHWLTRAGAAMETYSTRFNNPFDSIGGAPVTNSAVSVLPGDDEEVPYGLGCGGVIDLLLEPAALPETNATLLAFEAAERGESLYSVTLLPSPGQPGAQCARVIVREDSSFFFASSGLAPFVPEQLAAIARAVSRAETTVVSIDEEARKIFCEPILPPQRLVIFGAGEDTRPLARMASLLGWRITVADGRAWLAQAARFPEAAQVLALAASADNLAQLHLTNRDAVALVTHSFEQDKNLLRQLLPLDLLYVGLIGARHRSQLLLTKVAAQLDWTPEECLRRVHAPIGLDLGGDSPEAVALSILAEIQSVVHSKTIRSRRMPEDALRSVPEHPYIPAQCPLDNFDPSTDATPSTH